MRIVSDSDAALQALKEAAASAVRGEPLVLWYDERDVNLRGLAHDVDRSFVAACHPTLILDLIAKATALGGDLGRLPPPDWHDDHARGCGTVRRGCVRGCPKDTYERTGVWIGEW